MFKAIFIIENTVHCTAILIFSKLRKGCDAMNLMQCLFTAADCYKAGVKMKPAGVMVHSTGANNPNLRRYVQPIASTPGRAELLAKLGTNAYGNHWNQTRVYIYTDGTRTVGYRDYKKKLQQTLYEPSVHAFIGTLADGSVATVQTLPFDIKGWHCGSDSKGSANDTHISFEICEDGLTDATYFNKVYREAVEFTAHLCKLYNLDPMADGVVICHSEGHTRGIASNHGDVMHWFPKHGKNMDTFRADVAAALKSEKKEDEVTVKRYNTIAEVPAWAQPTVTKLVDKGHLGGSGKKKDANGRPADLDLSLDMIRVFVIEDRAGLYG